jgi:hypothetical protein
MCKKSISTTSIPREAIVQVQYNKKCIPPFETTPYQDTTVRGRYRGLLRRGRGGVGSKVEE